MKKDRDRIILHRVEIERVNAFSREHDHSTLILIETSGTSGIGTNVYVICDKCQQEKDITYYECW
jgi:hypothetical protein